MPPGNYAMVFVPNTADDKGMSVELRKLSVPEFLQPGTSWLRLRRGRRYGASRALQPGGHDGAGLRIDLAPHMTGTKLVVRYGDRRLERDLTY